MKMQNSNIIIAITKKGDNVGLVICDTNLCTFEATEFYDSNNWKILMSIIWSYEPKIIYLIKQNYKTNKVLELLKKNDVFVIELEKPKVNLFNSFKYQSKIKNRKKLSKWKKKTECSLCIVALIECNNLSSQKNKYKLSELFINSFIKLDHITINSLNIIGKNNQNYKQSLISILNHTKTNGMGNRLLKKWIKQPSREINEIVRRQNIVQTFILESNFIIREIIQNCLKKIPDIELLNRKLESGEIELKEIISLYSSIIEIKDVSNAIKKLKGPFKECIKKNFEEPTKLLNNNLNSFGTIVMKKDMFILFTFN